MWESSLLPTKACLRLSAGGWSETFSFLPLEIRLVHSKAVQQFDGFPPGCCNHPLFTWSILEEMELLLLRKRATSALPVKCFFCLFDMAVEEWSRPGVQVAQNTKQIGAPKEKKWRNPLKGTGLGGRFFKRNKEFRYNRNNEGNGLEKTSCTYIWARFSISCKALIALICLSIRTRMKKSGGRKISNSPETRTK